MKDNKFSSFCRRKWLDHCDENKAPLAVTYTEEEFKTTFNKWLLQKYAEEQEKKI